MASSISIIGAPWRQENIKDKKISKMTDRSFKHQPPNASMQATASARHHALAFMASFYGSRRVEVRSVFVTIVSRGVADSYMYSHRRNWMLRLKNY
jgi:hypothetical protein